MLPDHQCSGHQWKPSGCLPLRFTDQLTEISQRNVELIVQIEYPGLRKAIFPLPPADRAVMDPQKARNGTNAAGTIDKRRCRGSGHSQMLAFSTFSVNKNVETVNSHLGDVRQTPAMENSTTAGDRLRTLRELRKLDQMEVSVAAGVARSTLAGIEAGHNPPGRKTLMALAKFYGVSLDWLATGHGEMVLGKATAQTEDEALLLFAFRQMPEDESKPLLQMMLRRAGKGTSQ